MRFHPEITYGEQALAFQPVVRHSGLGGAVPGTVYVIRCAVNKRKLPIKRPKSERAPSGFELVCRLRGWRAPPWAETLGIRKRDEMKKQFMAIALGAA